MVVGLFLFLVLNTRIAVFGYLECRLAILAVKKPGCIYIVLTCVSYGHMCGYLYMSSVQHRYRKCGLRQVSQDMICMPSLFQNDRPGGGCAVLLH